MAALLGQAGAVTAFQASPRHGGFATSPRRWTFARRDKRVVPLVPGTRYVYRGSGRSARARHRRRRASHEDDRPGAVCRRQRPPVHPRSSSSGTTDWYNQDTHGTFVLRWDTAELDEHGRVTSTEGTWRAGVDGARAGVYMPTSPVGMSGFQEYYKGHAEDSFVVIGFRDRHGSGVRMDCLRRDDAARARRCRSQALVRASRGSRQSVKGATSGTSWSRPAPRRRDRGSRLRVQASFTRRRPQSCRDRLVAPAARRVDCAAAARSAASRGCRRRQMPSPPRGTADAAEGYVLIVDLSRNRLEPEPEAECGRRCGRDSPGVRRALRCGVRGLLDSRLQKLIGLHQRTDGSTDAPRHTTRACVHEPR